MLESEDESEGKENIVSNVDLSLVSVDRCTYNGSRCQVRVCCASDWRFVGSYLEQDVLNQQDCVPVGNVVVAVSCWDGKGEHAVSQELRVAHRHEGSVQGSLPRSGGGSDGHIGYLHGYAGRGGFLSGYSPSSLAEGEHPNESCLIVPSRRSHQAQKPQTGLYDNNKARNGAFRLDSRTALQAHEYSVNQSKPSPAFNSFSRSAGASASPSSSPAVNPSSLHLSHSHLKLHSRSLCCLAETGKPGST